MILAFIYDCCFGKSKLANSRSPVMSVEDVVLAMEALSKDDFRKVLKRYVELRSLEFPKCQECCQ